MADVTLDFQMEQPVSLHMDAIPRVGDWVNDEQVAKVEWYIRRSRDDSEPTYWVYVSFEEPPSPLQTSREW